MKHFFQNFPKITYQQRPALNLMKRAATRDSALQDPYLYYPYTLSHYERADQLANRYYGDPYASWILYFSNKVVDPYYGWYMTDREFETFVEKKYGSIRLAKRKTKIYQNNYLMENTLTEAGFDALPPIMKHYWHPKYDDTGRRLLNYVRRPADWYVTTNHIVAFTTYENGSREFQLDEKVNIIYSGKYSGEGQVAAATDTELYVQHTSGYTYPNPLSNDEIEMMQSGPITSTPAADAPVGARGYDIQITTSPYIHGEESGANIAFTSVRKVIDNLEPEEESYWTEVSYYDWENAKNEYNKAILILNKQYYQRVNDELKEALK